MTRKVSNGLDVRGAKIVNVGAGSNPADAVNFQQLSNAIRGLDLKEPVRATTTANLTALAAVQTVDGVVLSAGDRVLVKNQTDAKTNGIYVVAASTWSRSADADENIEVTRGFATTVLEGTTKGTSSNQSNPMLYELTNSVDPVIGTDNLTFAPVGAAGAVAYTQGTGIIINNGVIMVDPAYAGFSKRYATTIGDGTASSFTITHNLGTFDVRVDLLDATANYEEWDADVTRPTINTVQLVFASPPTANQFRVLVTY